MLRETIKRRQIDLLGLDPFVKLHALEENDNGAMDFVCDLLVKLAIEFNIAVDVPHHTKKGLQTAGDADAGRGASAARDAGRLMYTLTRMTDDEGDTFGIPAEERRLYVRLDTSKVNIAPPSGEATWFKLIGVHLDNGTRRLSERRRRPDRGPVAPAEDMGRHHQRPAQRRPGRDRGRPAERPALFRRAQGRRPAPRGRWCSGIARTAPSRSAARSSRRGSRTACCSTRTTTTRSTASPARAFASATESGLPDAAPLPQIQWRTNGANPICATIGNSLGHGDGAKPRAITPCMHWRSNGAAASRASRLTRYAPAALCLRRRSRAHRSDRWQYGLAGRWIVLVIPPLTRNSQPPFPAIALGIAARVTQRVFVLGTRLTSHRGIERIHGLPTASTTISGHCLGQRPPALPSPLNNINALAPSRHRFHYSVQASKRSAGQVASETEALAISIADFSIGPSQKTPGMVGVPRQPVSRAIIDLPHPHTAPPGTLFRSGADRRRPPNRCAMT